MNKKITIAVLTIGLIASASASTHSDSFFTGDFFENEFFAGEDDSSFFDDPFFTDGQEEQEDNSTNESNECGEVRIPEDQNCDGEIDDRFRGDNESGEDSENTTEVQEQRTVTPVPEPEAVGDGWISYPNPRDHVLDPSDINEDGDIKVCKVLLNSQNQVITGETVEGATFEVDTNISEGEPEYTDSNPILFEAPLNQVADLVGTSEEYIEGDGMLDAECAEYHNLPFGTYTYSNETITGNNSDQIELVGVTEYWDGRPEGGDPFTKQVYDYGENNLSDGKLTISPDEANNHAEVIFVNRLK